MSELVEILTSWITSAAAIFALLAWDERRLDEEQLARAWPVTTRRVAVIVFGALSVPIHFWRTRRSVGGACLGLFWMAVALALDAGVTALVVHAVGAT